MVSNFAFGDAGLPFGILPESSSDCACVQSDGESAEQALPISEDMASSSLDTCGEPALGVAVIGGACIRVSPRILTTPVVGPTKA